MLDYSETLRQQGIVKLKKKANEYVPTVPGIYRILAVPFSYNASDEAATPKKYITSLDRKRLDVRDSVQSNFDNNSGRPNLTIHTTPRYKAFRKVTISKEILGLALLFPAVYIGKAENLHNRFNDHSSGVNSHILSDLQEYGLSQHWIFFHWQYCSKDKLLQFESILIQANRPILNRRLVSCPIN